MKVKKYTAPSMPEAMKQVRKELGNDAVILNSRVVQTGGFIGFFKKNSIEVIAAIDPDTELASKPVNLDKSMKESPTSIKTEQRKTQLFSYKDHPSSIVEKDLVTEISKLKDMLKAAGNTSGIPLPAPVNKHLQHLRDQDVDQSIAEELTSILLEKWYLNGASASEGAVAEWSGKAIQQRMNGLSFGGVSFTKKFVNVIGPTGVGKTTTLAKIAADCVLKHQKKVAFITTDTYRIAAIEQLKTYANILHVPIEVCYTMDDFKEATSKLAQYDVVFIDTAGRNFRNQKYVHDLNGVIDFSEEMETFLVLALTSKQQDMEEIRKQFSLIPIDKFIFTKLDETSVYGSMLNIAEKFSTGIAYMTNGQDVPDDLIEASPEIAANTIIGAIQYE
ncbi:flagellar biosynthesis protein FlhF [Mesobacillus subterraneus]|uniref:Flagellar biosynthesis protein FlhF n=1 Tax=Mesobacillus subterraneus TaxID=285983 RepID=A0A0D6ZAA4_9BACI|nr:flagellar biosynthesis protein FlhF [Mesobacillus subterraneus]KIY21523.1 flagellar biosynthesis regulator FlhF [Mesobacillus subterraneus]